DIVTHISLSLIGYIVYNNTTKSSVRNGLIQARYHIEIVAKAHENAGFDRALLAFHSTTADGLQVGQHVLGVTERLNVLIAQRPGFTAPTLLARQLATIDQFSRGRVALHVITGGNATELKQDGNTIDDTEEKAWAKAEAILERATALQDKTGHRKPADGHATAGARRLLAIAEQGKRIDKRLWTEIAKLTGANSNTTALVGTPEQVAE